MPSRTAHEMVLHLERAAKGQGTDADVRNNLLVHIAHFYSIFGAERKLSPDDWRGILLCVRDLLDPDHPGYEIISGAIMTAMTRSEDLEGDCPVRRQAVEPYAPLTH